MESDMRSFYLKYAVAFGIAVAMAFSAATPSIGKSLPRGGPTAGEYVSYADGNRCYTEESAGRRSPC
jgi:hypothetical protein